MDEGELIWQYSKYYGDMLATAKRLYNSEEYYAATMIMFNAMELICKSVREDYVENFIKDLKWLNKEEMLSDEDYSFLNNKENGVRIIRNIMTHRNAYQYCLENQNGKALMFAEADTWQIIYDTYIPRIIQILGNLVKNKLSSEVNVEI